MHPVEVSIRLAAMTIIAQVGRRFWCFVAELVQLRDRARVDRAAMAFCAGIGGCFRRNTMSNQLERLVLRPGVSAVFADKCQS